MSAVAVIHQPDFLPYIGFFHRLLRADVFVLLDHVQFVHSGGWTHRDKIKTQHGAKWITVSVKKPRLNTAINQVEVSQTIDWKGDNLTLIHDNYRAAPYYDEIAPHVDQLYAIECTKLVDFTWASIKMLLKLFDIQISCVFASTLGVDGRKNELLVNILRALGSSHYVSGIGAKGYFDPEPFLKAGITVEWQEFAHPVYPQLHGGDFVPYLSSVDMLFNCGILESRRILRSC